MNSRKTLIPLMTAMTFLLISVYGFSCSAGRYLKTETAAPQELEGSYTLILYGGNYFDDVETFAVLGKEDAGYSFEVFAPAFDYRVLRDVPAKEALERARKFVSFHPDFWKTQLSGIVDGQGKTIGYELKPLYYPSVFGRSDLFDLYYKKTGGKVIVYIRSHRNQGRDIPFIGGRHSGPR